MTGNNGQMKPHPDARPVRRSDVTIQELDGEALVYDPVTADTHRLNETAYFIWQACDGRMTAAHVAERLLESYDVAPKEATSHTNRLLGELLQRGLLLCDPPEVD